MSSPGGLSAGRFRVNVVVNGEACRLPAPATVVDAVATVLPGAARRVAVARNGEVVPRSAWADTTLADGDRLEVLAPIQGGSG